MLYGRDRELAAISGLLDNARRGAGGALVLRGAPGVGKSALIDAGRAGADGMHVLAARGVESESELPFAGLHQLIRPMLGRLSGVADRHRTALEHAFGSGAGTSQERFRLYSACLDVVSELSADAPVLCLVDDAQWLDTGSSDALQFVARRLDRESIALLIAARDGDVRRFDPADLPSLQVHPLDPEAAVSLLRRTTDSAHAGVTEQLLAHARGNPLALIELPKALTDAQLTGAEPFPDVLPLTDQLEAAFNDRARRLPQATRTVLLLAAADSSEDLRLITRAGTAIGVEAGSLDPAERAGLITVSGNRLVFRHPLIRSAVWGTVTSAERRIAHRALADALAADDAHADRRAWHLAAAALEPDAEIVVELDDVAARAEARGAHAAAALALERAADLCSEPSTRAAHLIHAARNLSLLGHDQRAVALADRTAIEVLDPPERKDRALVRVTAASRWRGNPLDVVPELTATTRHIAPTHPHLAIELLLHATSAAWQGWDQQAQRDIARVAADIDLDRLDHSAQVVARSLAGYAALLDGRRPEALRLLGDTVRWGATTDDPRHVIWASWAALWTGDEESFEQLLHRAAELARARGELGALTETLGMQSVHLALVTQRYDDSLIAATEAVQLARDLSADSLSLVARSALAVVAAVRGDDDDARRHGGHVIRVANTMRQPFRASPALYALALHDLAAGRWNDALERLGPLIDANDPVTAITAPDIVEAAGRAGHPHRAERAMVVYQARIDAQPSALQPRLASCRALLAGAAQATRHFQTAIEQLPAARPFDRPRIQLLYGEHLRRLGRRLDAREHLRAAVEGFEDIGARPWAERARTELLATGETARPRRPDTATQLTPQERQIARLVAQGLTNKDVANQLYLSPRTIDAHLRAVFAKLGVTSRRQLAAHIPAD